MLLALASCSSDSVNGTLRSATAAPGKAPVGRPRAELGPMLLALASCSSGSENGMLSSPGPLPGVDDCPLAWRLLLALSKPSCDDANGILSSSARPLGLGPIPLGLLIRSRDGME